MTRTSEAPAPPTAGTAPPRCTTAPPRPAPPPPRRPRTAALAVGAVGAVVAVVAAGAALGLGAPAPENRYESVGSTGEYPFTSPVGTDESVVPLAPGGPRPGDTAGLYLRDPARPACDGSALVSRLAEDPAGAGAWARVRQATPDGIAAFVADLTPVVLRADTAVVDHGYRDGVAVPTPAVLAAGTAVFVDRHGTPAVKCSSGDPLTPGSTTDPAVTTVDPSVAPITTWTVLDPTVGRLVEAPAGTGTTGDGRVPR